MTVEKIRLTPSLFDALVEEGWEEWELVKRTGKDVFVNVSDDGFGQMTELVDYIAESDPEDYERGVRQAASRWRTAHEKEVAARTYAYATTKAEQVAAKIKGLTPAQQQTISEAISAPKYNGRKVNAVAAEAGIPYEDLKAHVETQRASMKASWGPAFEAADKAIRARSPIPAAATEADPAPATPAKKVLKSALDPAATPATPAAATPASTTPAKPGQRVLKSALDPAATPPAAVTPVTKPEPAPKAAPAKPGQRVLKSAVDPAATPTPAATPKPGKTPKTPKGAAGPKAPKSPAAPLDEVSDAIDAEIEFQRRTAGRTPGLGKSGITENIGEYRDLIDELEQQQKVIGSDADIEAGKAKVVSATPAETVSDRVDESYSRLEQIKAEQRAKRAAARGLGNVEQVAQAEAEAESLRAARAQLGLTASPVVDEVTVEAAQQFSDRRRALDAKVAQGMLSADDAAKLLQAEFDALDPAAKQIALRTAQKAQELAEQGARNAVAAGASEAADLVLAANMKADPRYVSPVAMSSDHLRDVSGMSNQSYGSLRKQLTGLGMSPDEISGLSPAARSGMSLTSQLAPPALGATGYPTPFGYPHTMPAPAASLAPPALGATGYPTPFGYPHTMPAPVIASQATQNAARAAAQATGGGGFGPPTGPATPGLPVPGGAGGGGSGGGWGAPTGPAGTPPPIHGPAYPGPAAAEAGFFDDLLFKAGGAKNMAKLAGQRLPGALGWMTAGQMGGGLLKSVWDDPESQLDDAASSALSWGGSGAALGSMILPGWGTAIGGGLGLLAGGVKGWLDGDGASQEDISNAAAEQRAKLDAAFDRLGVSAEARQDLYDRIEVQVALGAKSADDVKAIYAQAGQMAPDVIAQSRRQAKLAALQAAILPMMQQNRDMAMQRNQAAQGWLNQAASTSSDPTVAALLRAQGETLMGNAANYSNASYGQALAMPTLMDLYGTAGPYPTDSSTGLVDYQNLMAQLQPAR